MSIQRQSSFPTDKKCPGCGGTIVKEEIRGEPPKQPPGPAKYGPRELGPYQGTIYYCEKCKKEFSMKDVFRDEFANLVSNLDKESESVDQEPEQEIVGTCTACKGNVVEEKTKKHDSSTGPPIIGPAGKNQRVEVTTYHCNSCGLMYSFPSKNQKKPSKQRESESGHTPIFPDIPGTDLF